MTYAEPAERTELIDGLRACADYLESNPNVPVTYGATIYAFPPNGECAGMRAEIDAIAVRLGTDTSEAAKGGHYGTTRYFGPVEYRAVAICKQPCHADAEEETE